MFDSEEIYLLQLAAEFDEAEAVLSTAITEIAMPVDNSSLGTSGLTTLSEQNVDDEDSEVNVIADEDPLMAALSKMKIFQKQGNK